MDRTNMEDRAAITDLVARFDDAVNRRDVSEFRNLWAEDAIWEIGEPMPLHVKGRDEIEATWQQMLGATEWLFRGSFLGVIEIEGDIGTGRWPCVETGVFKAQGEKPATGYDNRALYEDRYVMRDGQWRFALRRYLYLWLSTEALPGRSVALGPEVVGRQT